jgi:hypothetical protein
MEKQMNLKRAFLIMIAALLLPGMAWAQEDARFLVSKDFTDDNNASIEVSISCNTGVPLTQSATITELSGVGFVVAGFDPAIGSCTVTEDGEAGYTGSYVANGGTASATSCVFSGGEGGNWAEGDQTCEITNAATPIRVTVFKVWNLEGAGGDDVDMYSSFEIESMGEITGGSPCFDRPAGNGNDYNCARLSLYGDDDGSVLVTPSDGGTTVYISEMNEDSSVEVSNNCGGSVTIEPGDAATSCTFTNTVFFEGIPTLNQYGMAILVLLMLGVGFVGFRRFA